MRVDVLMSIRISCRRACAAARDADKNDYLPDIIKSCQCAPNSYHISYHYLIIHAKNLGCKTHISIHLKMRPTTNPITTTLH